MTGPQVCKQCGNCCRLESVGIYATVDDQRRWVLEKRSDILCYFRSRQEGNGWCDEFTDPDGVTVIADMLTPAGYPYKTCPFRRKIKEGKYVCRIHETKPELCKDFTPWSEDWISHGESYEWCEAVKPKI